MVYVKLTDIKCNEQFYASKLGMNFNCGTFVLYKCKNNEGKTGTTEIGRVLEVDKFEKSLKINKFNLLVERSSTTAETHCRHIPEIEQSEELDWIGIEAVTALAFIHCIPNSSIWRNARHGKFIFDSEAVGR